MMELLVMLMDIIKPINNLLIKKKDIYYIYYKMARGKYYSKEKEIARQCYRRFQKKSY